MSLPFIQTIKVYYPKAEIYIICKDWVSDIFRNHNELKGVISLSNSDLKGMQNVFSVVKMLKSQNFDLSYTLTDSFRSAFIFWLAKIQKRTGFNTQLRGPLLTEKVPIPKTLIHRSEKYLKLIDKKIDNRVMPKLFLSQKEILWAKKKMEQIGFKNPTALFPFSVGTGRTLSSEDIKRWIKGSSKSFLVFGSIKDAQKAKAIIKECKKM